MSRPVYAPKQTYLGNGGLSAYTFNFKIEAASQLLIIEVDNLGVETQRVLGTDVVYLASVTFDSVEGGGTVNLAANLTNNYNLIILLANDAPTQPFEFRNKTTFTLKRFESALDFIAGAVQRLTYRGKQAFRIHDLDDEDTFNSQLPPNIALALDRVIAVNPAGDGITFGPTATNVDNAEGYANAAQVSAGNAAASENNAANSAAAALVSENNAAASAAIAVAQIMWTKVTFAFATLSTAGLTTTIEALELAAKETVHAVLIKHSNAFVGAGITDLDLDVGVAGEEDRFIYQFGGLQAVAEAARQEANMVFIGNLGSVTSLKLKATSIGANLDQLSQGSVDIYFLIRTLP